MRKLWHFFRSAFKTSTPNRRERRMALNLEHLEVRLVLATNLVPYGGGPLLHNVQIKSVYYGQPWTTDATLQQTIEQTDGFLHYFVTSPYLTLLQQYGVGDGTFLNHDIVNQNPSGGQVISDTQIHQVLATEIGAGRLAAPGPNSLYVFFTAPNVVVTANGLNSINDFAGYHDVFQDSAGASVYYAVIPYPSGNIAPTTAMLTTFQQETIALSHEVAESITDPDTRTGWTDAQGDEIADLANGQFGTMHGYVVSGVWSQVVGLVVTPTDTSGANLAVGNTQIQATNSVAFSSLVATAMDLDPGATAGEFTATIAWGDGTTSPGTIQPDPNGGFDVFGTHTYGSSSGVSNWHFPGHHNRVASSYEVAVTIQNTTDNTVGLAVSNANVGAAPPSLVASSQNIKTSVGTTFSGTVASFTDADTQGTSGFTVSIAWGDGTSSTGTVSANTTGGYLVAGTHTYASAGTDTVDVSIKDADGNSAVAADTATVAALPPFTAVALGFLQSSEYETGLVMQDYLHYLGRTASNSEVMYWVNAMQQGTADVQVAAGFLSSSEFFTKAGNTNTKWVDALYLDVLGRPADSAGESYWLQQLAAGTSMNTIALGFLTSQERASQIVQSDYRQYLSRAGSTSEIAYWANTMQQGSGDIQVLSAILGSPEYYGRAGDTDQAWLDSLYQNLLHRPADTTGESYWLGVLTSDGV